MWQTCCVRHTRPVGLPRLIGAEMLETSPEAAVPPKMSTMVRNTGPTTLDLSVEFDHTHH